jgi:hypothetical protein
MSGEPTPEMVRDVLEAVRKGSELPPGAVPFLPEIVRGLMGARFKRSQLPPGVEPVTPKEVQDLLMKVMKKGKPPGVKDERIMRLTGILNELQWTAQWLRARSAEEVEREKRVAEAIGVLLAEERAPMPRFEALRARAEERRSDLADLIAAAKVAEERLRLHSNVLEAVVEHWPKCIPFLMEAFEAAVGHYPEALYGFIAAVKPRLTGKGTTPGSVKFYILEQWEKDILALHGWKGTD